MSIAAEGSFSYSNVCFDWGLWRLSISIILSRREQAMWVKRLTKGTSVISLFTVESLS